MLAHTHAHIHKHCCRTWKLKVWEFISFKWHNACTFLGCQVASAGISSHFLRGRLVTDTTVMPNVWKRKKSLKFYYRHVLYRAGIAMHEAAQRCVCVCYVVLQCIGKFIGYEYRSFSYMPGDITRKRKHQKASLRNCCIHTGSIMLVLSLFQTMYCNLWSNISRTVLLRICIMGFVHTYIHMQIYFHLA